MPFTRVGFNNYTSPSGRHFTSKQIKLYYATNGFEKGVKKMKRKPYPILKGDRKTMKKKAVQYMPSQSMMRMTKKKRKFSVKNDHDVDDMMKKKKKKKHTMMPGQPMMRMTKKKVVKKASGAIKHTGSFGGKSNQLGQGGRAAQMRARGVPGGVIGAIARREGAAPGQPNYHKRKGKKKK